MVSRASGGQQRIREAVSERPGGEFTQDGAGISFMLQRPFEDLFFRRFQNSSQVESTGMRIPEYDVQMQRLAYMSFHVQL